MSDDAQGRAKDMTDKMDEILDLTDAQYRQAMEVNLRYYNQLDQMRARYAGQEDANKEQMKAKKDELSANV